MGCNVLVQRERYHPGSDEKRLLASVIPDWHTSTDGLLPHDCFIGQLLECPRHNKHHQTIDPKGSP